MARVQVASQAWGYVVDRRGRPRSGALCALDTTVYAAATGETVIPPAQFKSGSTGLLPGFVEPGAYTFTDTDGDELEVTVGAYGIARDEVSVLPRRDTLVFEGDAVQVQDDAGNGRTRVIVTGSPGTQGPPGEIFGVDVWFSQEDPDAVTDWGPTINTLVAGSGPILPARLLLFRGKDFPYTTPLVLYQENQLGARLVGELGDSWFAPASGKGYPRLIYKGTGAATAIRCGSGGGGGGVQSGGVELENLVFGYDSGTYTGMLIDGRTTTKMKIRGCYVGRIGADTGSSARLVGLGQTIDFLCENSTFSGAVRYIDASVNAAPDNWVNTAVFRNVTFQGHCTYSLVDPGDSWVVDSCLFESVGTVTAHIRFVTENPWGTSFTMRDSTHWDPDHDCLWVDQVAGFEAHLLFENNTDHGPAPVTKCMSLLGNGNVTFIGGVYLLPVDFGDGSVAAQQKGAINLFGPSFSDSPIGLNTGHKNVFPGALVDFDNASEGGWTGWRNRVFMEVADNREWRPTAAVAAGAPAGTAVHELKGNDRSGKIVIRNDSGGALAAGTLIEMTQEQPPAVISGEPALRPRVHLTPVDANAVAVGAYVPEPTVVNKWRIASANATLPAGQTAGFNYHVTYTTEQA